MVKSNSSWKLDQQLLHISASEMFGSVNDHLFLALDRITEKLDKL